MVGHNRYIIKGLHMPPNRIFRDIQKQNPYQYGGRQGLDNENTL